MQSKQHHTFCNTRIKETCQNFQTLQLESYSLYKNALWDNSILLIMWNEWSVETTCRHLWCPLLMSTDKLSLDFMTLNGASLVHAFLYLETMKTPTKQLVQLIYPLGWRNIIFFDSLWLPGRIFHKNHGLGSPLHSLSWSIPAVGWGGASADLSVVGKGCVWFYFAAKTKKNTVLSKHLDV